MSTTSTHEHTIQMLTDQCKVTPDADFLCSIVAIAAIADAAAAADAAADAAAVASASVTGAIVIAVLFIKSFGYCYPLQKGKSRAMKTPVYVSRINLRVMSPKTTIDLSYNCTPEAQV
uniref:Uncharacterized protein n=1 Tax=Glossina austeni TaxID=7395 RepID=A0A1A9V3M3_GLOAU